jgi:hypothetical protein
MKEEIRRAVAFAILAPEEGEQDCVLYSYVNDRRSKFSGNRSDFHDYDCGADVARDGEFLYHYGLWHHIKLDANADRFSGYDHGAKCHFEGVVRDGIVQLYDHEEGRYFDYVLSDSRPSDVPETARQDEL